MQGPLKDGRCCLRPEFEPQPWQWAWGLSLSQSRAREAYEFLKLKRMRRKSFTSRCSGFPKYRGVVGAHLVPSLTMKLTQSAICLENAARGCFPESMTWTCCENYKVLSLAQKIRLSNVPKHQVQVCAVYQVDWSDKG